MSKTQNALEKNIAKLSQKKPKTKVKRKTKQKEQEIFFQKIKRDAESMFLNTLHLCPIFLLKNSLRTKIKSSRRE